MHLPTLPLSSNFHVYTEGDVSIDASAAIAPGVILRAGSDSKIVIAAGVCIGMGSILNAHGGTLEVEAGANLGAGVLIVGKGTIGANTCIGAVTTIWNASVEPWQVVPAGSVVGDQGRQVTEVSSVSSNTPQTETKDTTDSSSKAKANVIDSSVSVPASHRLDAHSASQESLNGQASSNPSATSHNDRREHPLQDSPTETEAEDPSLPSDQPVYGQGSLDRILKTLFPYNQSLNRPPEDV